MKKPKTQHEKWDLPLSAINLSYYSLHWMNESIVFSYQMKIILQFKIKIWNVLCIVSAIEWGKFRQGTICAFFLFNQGQTPY